MSYPASLGLLLIRGIVGFVMVYHGAQKLFAQKFGAFGNFGGFGGGGMKGFIEHVPDLGIPGVPKEALAWAAAVAEFGGGILLMVGLATRLAAIPIAITMGVAVFKVHGAQVFSGPGGIEFPLTLMLVAIGLVCTGPGRFALDSLFRRSKAPEAFPERKRSDAGAAGGKPKR